MPQEEKGSSDVEWIIKEKGTEMLKMMLEAIWYRIEWIVLGCIGKTKFAIQWLHAPSILVREFGQLSSLVTPSGRLDVDSSKFPSVKIPRFVSSRTQTDTLGVAAPRRGPAQNK